MCVKCGKYFALTIKYGEKIMYTFAYIVHEWKYTINFPLTLISLLITYIAVYVKIFIHFKQ